jgi:hypothetical protein
LLVNALLIDSAPWVETQEFQRPLPDGALLQVESGAT